MRVLVTGGAGFVGSTTAAALVSAGHDVLIADDLSAGCREHVPAQADFAQVDVMDPDAMGDLLATDRVDACLHFAALIDAGESMSDAARYMTVNTAGTLRLLDALKHRGVQRFVLSSTAAVYGEPHRAAIDEDDPRVPTNPYGASKLLIEQALSWYTRVHGMRAAALRYFNAAGATPGRPERHHPETHLIPLVLEVAAGAREAINVYGTDYPTADGTAVRDYVHVADLAAAHVTALERLSDQASITCNLGTGHGYSVREVIDTVRHVTGRPIKTISAPRRPGDPAHLVASNTRARELLDWTPRRSDLTRIVTDAWRYRSDSGASGRSRGA